MWKKIGFLSIFIFFIFLDPNFASAEEIRVTDEDTLITALEEASDGDVIILEEGEYHGNFVIENSIEFKGEDGAHIKGPDTGYPLIIEADDVLVENLHVEGGGTDAAGIFSQGDRNQITYNTISNVFHGILVRDGHSNNLTENKISSWDDADRSYGYAMYVINGDGTMVSHNETYDTQDGVWISHSTSAIVNYNRFINARYGIHTIDRKSTRLNSSHVAISYAVFCLKKKNIFR